MSFAMSVVFPEFFLLTIATTGGAMNPPKMLPAAPLSGIFRAQYVRVYSGFAFSALLNQPENKKKDKRPDNSSNQVFQRDSQTIECEINPKHLKKEASNQCPHQTDPKVYEVPESSLLTSDEHAGYGARKGAHDDPYNDLTGCNGNTHDPP
jgi:hypothetical protein